jgi:hypothetical protein
MSVVRTVARRGAHGILRHRFLVLALWAIPWFVAGTLYRDNHLTDWLTFEFGARALIHYNVHYGGGGLHLYANYSFIQIGPPALLVVAATQWLPHNASSVGLAAIMALAGLWGLRCAESTARALLPAERQQNIAAKTFGAGLLAIPIWSYESAQWRHLDDVMAICFILAATSLIARQRYWWLAGIGVGLGVAAKPWALILAPVLLGLSRSERPKAAIAALATATACWAPFVIGGPGTVSSLGSLRLHVSAMSSLHTLGVSFGAAPSWVRPVQMVGGFILMAIIARRSHWVAIPFAGLAFRVVSDPQTWLYYGMGPVMAAVLWDVLQQRRWPVWTIATVGVEYGVYWVSPGSTGAARLLWALAILVSCLLYRRIAKPESPEGQPMQTGVPELQPAA